MGKKDKERRNYSKEFKAGAAALAEKREKPVSRTAGGLGVNGSVPRRRTRQNREAVQGGLPAFPGHGRLRDGELARLRKEVKALREANEILKKAAERQSAPSSRKPNPADGVPVHKGEPGTVHHREDGRAFWGQLQCLLPMGEARGVNETERAGRRIAGPHTGDCAKASLSVWEPTGTGSVAPGLRETGQSEKSGLLDAGKRP
jgi:transposase-like protein